MYYFFNWPKMSVSIAGAGVESCGVRRPHSTSRCCGGGGCGELVNGDGSSAAAATATSATPAQCSDRESNVAEAQAFSEWDNATCITADPARKKNKDGFFVNGTADIIREGGEYVDSGNYRLNRFSAAARQSVGPGEDNSINIDYEARGSQHGGEPWCFMGAASRTSECRARLQAVDVGREAKGQTAQAETEGASMTAATRCGHQKPEPALSKRRGCSFTRSSKRVCFAGTGTVAYCGNPDAESRVSLRGEALIKSTAGKSGVLKQSSTESSQSVCQMVTLGGRRGSPRRVQDESAAGSTKLNFLACAPSVSGGGSGVNTAINVEGPTSRTAKGRVRLYRVRSFLASSLEHQNGVSCTSSASSDLGGDRDGNPRGIVHGNHAHDGLTLSSKQDVESQHQQKQQPRQRGRLKKSTSPPCVEKQSGTSNGADSILQNSACTDHRPHTRYVSSGEVADGMIGGTQQEALSEELVEAVRGQAGERQVELEGRRERLWRRLQAVQVKQVERHVTQQLQGLSRVPGWNCGRRTGALARSSTELNRLALSCSEVLRSAEGALDSDHTASSSGGSSESEEDTDAERGVVHTMPHLKKKICTGRELQWAENRAWLGSRWVWLQAQVSELEYRIRALTELYTHLRQGKVRAAPSQNVPDTPWRAPRPPPASQLCRLPSAVEPLRKRQTEDPTPIGQTPLSPPSSAARVRPVPRQRRHKLIRLEGSAALGSKPVSVPCWCEPPAVCVMCASAPPRPPSLHRECVRVRRAALDVCVHPVLSSPAESPIALHCGFRPLVGSRAHNSLQWTGMSAPPPWLGRRGQGPQRTGRVRRRLVCPRPPNALPPLFNGTSNASCRGQRSMFSPSFISQRIPDFPPLPATPPAIDTPTQPLRRRRGESSFDIDNLVMPLGLAGLGARVQKLQYKEIITPSWRELDSEDTEDPELPVKPSQAQSETAGDTEEDTEEVEDLSDTAFLSRHAVCENRERSRWGSWALRRQRRRSSSGHGDGKQAPCSPDPRQGPTAEGETSPPSPSYPGAEDLYFNQTEDEVQTVLPWECRTFPLLEAELQWLQEEEEAELDEDPCAASGRSQSTDSGISVGSLELSPRTPQPFLPAHTTTQDTSSLCPPSHSSPLFSNPLRSTQFPSIPSSTQSSGLS